MKPVTAMAKNLPSPESSCITEGMILGISSRRTIQKASPQPSHVQNQPAPTTLSDRRRSLCRCWPCPHSRNSQAVRVL